jgi:flagellar biogenesis protein FliO
VIDRMHSGTAMLILIAVISAVPAALGDNHPLELGDEEIWLGTTLDEQAATKVKNPANQDQPLPKSTTTVETKTQSADATISAQPIDMTPLPRTSQDTAPANTDSTNSKRSSSSWTRTILSLAAVVALIALLAWGYRLTGGWARGASFFNAGRRTQLLEVVGRTSLSPRHSLCLVRMGGRVVLVGLSGDRMTALDSVGDTEASRLLGLIAAEQSDSAHTAFEQTLADESAAYDLETDQSSKPASSSSSARDTIANTLQRIRSRIGRGVEQHVG